MRRWIWLAGVAAALAIYGACGGSSNAATSSSDGGADGVKDFASKMIDQGRDTFRNDTFGDEAFWDAIQLNKGVEAVDPKTALAVGLKVDSEKLDSATIDAIKNNSPALTQPATTAALLKAGAVVGVKAQVDAQNHITSLGITCALCHSTVDNSIAPGVGKRQDGWPNRDLDVGTIVSLAKNLQPVVDLLNSAGNSFTPQQVVDSIKAWGPGKFDAEVFMDGKAGVNPATGKSAATLIPAAFGLAGVNLHTYTGWGSVTHWNAFVANLEMHGVGTFFDTRLDDAAKFPIAAKNKFGHVTTAPANDKITSKLAALHLYQLSIDAPKPPAGSFDAAAAARGKAVFEDAARGNCASCHVPPLYTEPGWNMHAPADLKIDSFQADRAPDGKYRTTPLRGLWARMQAAPVTEASTAQKDRTGHGFYHDGRYPTLDALLTHYQNDLGAKFPGATDKADLIEYLKSL
jgi:mono/diheme cytochrome c family protein